MSSSKRCNLKTCIYTKNVNNVQFLPPILFSPLIWWYGLENRRWVRNSSVTYEFPTVNNSSLRTHWPHHFESCCDEVMGGIFNCVRRTPSVHVRWNPADSPTCRQWLRTYVQSLRISYDFMLTKHSPEDNSMRRLVSVVFENWVRSRDEWVSPLYEMDPVTIACGVTTRRAAINVCAILLISYRTRIQVLSQFASQIAGKDLYTPYCR